MVVSLCMMFSFIEKLVGVVQYATITRPKIAYNVNRVCQFMQAPLEAHQQVVIRILRHLPGSLDSGMIFQLNTSSSITLEGYFDVD